MPLIVATWPDNTVSIVKAPGEWDALWLFDALDAEGDPSAAEVFIVRGHDAHIGFLWSDDGKSIWPYPYDGSFEQWQWPEDVVKQYYDALRNAVPAHG
jgi:hypothetical protein